MALRNTATASATPTPAFESAEGPPGEEQEVGTPRVSTTAPTQAPAPGPAPSKTTAVAAPAQTQAASSPLSATTAMKALEWAIPAQELELMGFGVFPRITVGLDGFSRDKDTELGKKIKVAVLSWNPVWFVVTGEQNNTEANKLIRTSYDGRMLKGGEGSVESYVHMLKSDGYDKTSVKQYVEVYCNVLEHQDADGKTVVVSDADQEIVQVSLSPQSASQWMRYLLESGLRRARGIEDTNVVVLTQNKKVLGPNKFGYATFSPK